jgi:hypothetical protein
MREIKISAQGVMNSIGWVLKILFVTWAILFVGVFVWLFGYLLIYQTNWSASSALTVGLWIVGVVLALVAMFRIGNYLEGVYDRNPPTL